MRPRTSSLALAIMVVLLASGFGCQTPMATRSPSTVSKPTSVAPSAPVTSPTVQASATPSSTGATAPAPTPNQSVPPKPTSFVLGALTINPTAAMAGEQVTCSIQVSNTGSTEGSYTVIFNQKSSGGSLGSENVEITLKAGQTKTATLTKTQKESGTYFVNVNDNNSQYTVTTPIYAVPATSASAVTSPPPSMVGVNTHADIFGTGADPNMITLGPKLGSHPDWTAYATHCGTTFELGIRGTPVLAPIDMMLVGFKNNSATTGIGADGQPFTPFDDLNLYFESTSPEWPGMIIKVYHLYSSPLLLGQNIDPDCRECEKVGDSFQAQGHLFFFNNDNYVAEQGTASACQAQIGYTVKRGELIGFAGSVGTHSFTDICFKVSDTSENPTVNKGNRYLHWVQAASFFYWKSYSPDAVFPNGVLAYPFECDGYQLPAEQRNANFKYTARK
jgi:murein DD-endopeptidase MepM/ murein hydrolase activator NlpD